MEALEELRRGLRTVRFPLELAGADECRGMRDRMVAQLDDYVVPRLAALDAPLLAVVGGSTGAGKSTLVNSLVGVEVAEAGVLRPTTLAPTLVVNPADEPWFSTQRILPGLPRVTGSGAAEPGSLRVVAEESVPTGLALLDAPDIDSVVRANRELATQLLGAADLWIFLTTAARYADEVPWGFLRDARERATALALVLDRVPAEAAEEVAADFRRLLAENGLGETPLFTIAELGLTGEGLLPAPAVRPVREWLGGLAADAEARADVVRRTLAGALGNLAGRVPALAEGAEAQLAAEAALRRDAVGAYEAAMASFDDGMRDGSLLRGEVLARWQEFIGTGELMRSLETRIGRLRDRIVAAFTGRPLPEARLRVALETGVESLIRACADEAAERTVDAWAAHPAGRPLLGDDLHLARASAGLPERAAATVRDWQGYVLELVREEGASKRSAARLASFGVNGAGLLLMLVVFAQTGGLTGVEVGIAGGTSVVSQKVLEAIFGDQAVRQLAATARDDLRARVEELLVGEARRFTDRLHGLRLSPRAPDDLRAAARAVRDSAGEVLT
ncbi:ABC transporter [Bailinhaonella thermotolerans]|uniref:ABC transporter n=1 Tax=Bailinhaonella thermotolerans TaxID=1070861 RepID=A0A3A4AVF0_9ACTN|nr:ABC transporter [Bailinhaonella thermotolerans]